MAERRSDPAPTRIVRVRRNGVLFDVEYPTVESRLVPNFREATTDNPGVVLADDGTTYVVLPDGTREPLPGGGGGSAGSPIIRGPFEFAFDTPDLLTGVPFYTPTIGEILIDVWVEIDTAWDGETPQGDVGDFASQEYGWFGNWNYPIVMSVADVANNQNSGTNLLTQASNGDTSGKPSSLSLNNLVGFGITGSNLSLSRFLPGKFVNDNPIKVCVSQTGQNNGDDPGSTQGSAKLYMITATPVPFGS